MTAAALLDITDLVVDYRTRRHDVHALQQVSLEVRRGEVTALVGESGSGKSTLAQAAIGLLPSNAVVRAGSIGLHGEGKAIELVGLSERRWRRLRGPRIGLIPQDPTASLNPVTTIEAAVAEPLRIHGEHSDRQIRARVLEMLARVGIDDPELRAGQYPHELSGGLRQRVLIAAALILNPELIIADEPTSALDVTVQKTVLDLIDQLRIETGAGVLLITHDLAVAADRADRLAVLRNGTLEDSGPAAQVLREPASTYTRDLLRDAPALGRVVERVPPPPGEALVRIRELRQVFGTRSDPFVAVDGVSFTVDQGTTHALVGESGSGKTTIGRAIAGLRAATSGQVEVAGTEVSSVIAHGRRAQREFFGTTQLVYQSPYASLDPRQTVAGILAEPLRNFGLARGAAVTERVREALELVSLTPEFADRRPRELSGGQRQRVAIARALIIEPRLVILDEAVSALDVTVQAQILRLLADLQRDLGLTYVFISHDLAVVRQVADTVSVLERGRQVESGPVAKVFDDPQDRYTLRLLAAIPGGRVRGELDSGTVDSGTVDSGRIDSGRIDRLSPREQGTGTEDGQ